MDAHIIVMLEMYCLPPGPMDDIEKRVIIERHMESLSPSNVLELLDWVESPSFPDGKARDHRWVDVMRGEAVRIAARVDKETHNEAVRKKLEALVQVRELRVHALVGLRVLEDPSSVETLRHWMNDPDPDVVYNLTAALAEIASEEAIVILQEMSATRNAEPNVRGCIADSLQDAIAKKKWRDRGGV